MGSIFTLTILLVTYFLIKIWFNFWCVFLGCVKILAQYIIHHLILQKETHYKILSTNIFNLIFSLQKPPHFLRYFLLVILILWKINRNVHNTILTQVIRIPSCFNSTNKLHVLSTFMLLLSFLNQKSHQIQGDKIKHYFSLSFLKIQSIKFLKFLTNNIIQGN